MLVELNINECLEADAYSNKLSRTKDEFGAIPVEPDLVIHRDLVNGRAKRAFCKWLVQPFNPTIIDHYVGKQVKFIAGLLYGCRIRATSIPGEPLYVYKNDEPNSHCVSVEMLSPNLYALHGWRLAAEVMKMYFNERLFKPAHVCGRFSLNEMDALSSTLKKKGFI